MSLTNNEIKRIAELEVLVTGLRGEIVVISNAINDLSKSIATLKTAFNDIDHNLTVPPVIYQDTRESTLANAYCTQCHKLDPIGIHQTPAVCQNPDCKYGNSITK